MINLRVKTLDSQDHEFSVEDDITVRQFKERIQEKTGIEINLQRLIYCGRVMNDDNPLSEYNVNGKVVHLVQRPPPGTTSRATSSSSTGSNTEASTRRSENGRNLPFFQVIDGAVLGAMAIPMNTNSGTTQSVTHSMNPSSSLCMNRITVARHMLNCANNIANYLEDPSRGLNSTDMDMLTQQTMESTVFEVGISAVSDADVPQQDVQNLVQAFQGVVSAAFRQNGLQNISVDTETGTTQASIPLVFSASSAPTIEINATGATPSVRLLGVGQNGNRNPISISVSNPDAAGAEESAAEAEAAAASAAQSAEQPNAASASEPEDRPSPSASNEAANGENSSNNAQQTTSPLILAEVVQQMRTVQTRLEPFIQQYYEILLNDPVFEESDTANRESSQRVFDRVSEALHYFSHAQHAISDLMLDLSLGAPRHLCCRPILVEQSAYVSSGFAVPNIVSLNRRAPTAVSQETNNNNSNAATNNNNMTTSNANSETAEGAQAAPTASTAGASAASQSQDSRTDALRNVARIMQAMINPIGATADIHVEINQSPPGMEPHIEIHQAPPQQSQQPSSAAPGAPNGAADQADAQPRVTTATHPTTSTQTRSTARPQIHVTGLPTGQVRNLRPVPIPSMQLSSFDRYLPCNSHHIRENEQREHLPPPINIPRSRIHIQRPAVARTTIPADFAALLSSRRGSLQSFGPPSATSNSQAAAADAPDAQIAPSRINLDANVPIFGSNVLRLQVRDLLNLALTPATLNRIRLELREFLMDAMSLSALSTDEHINSAANQLAMLFNPRFMGLPELVSDEIDAKASIENLIRKTLPFIISLIRDDDSTEFGCRLLREIVTFSKRLTVILLRSVDRAIAQSYLTACVDSVFSAMPSAENDQIRMTLEWLHLHIEQEVQKRFRAVRPDTVEVIEYLVIRRPTTEAAIASVAAPSVAATTQDSAAPMETDADDGDASMMSEAVEEPPEDLEPLPTVTIGSESWHQNLPAPWLPIITRDISRQRIQSPQRPFSDAYISGMSSKRRKLINGSKPAISEPTSILSQGVRQVLQSRVGRTAGASSSSSAANASALDEAIASNPHIQEPYGSFEQAILDHVQSRVQNDPDFSSERFPNSAKWVKKNK